MSDCSLYKYAIFTWNNFRVARDNVNNLGIHLKDIHNDIKTLDFCVNKFREYLETLLKKEYFADKFGTLKNDIDSIKTGNNKLSEQVGALVSNLNTLKIIENQLKTLTENLAILTSMNLADIKSDLTNKDITTFASIDSRLRNLESVRSQPLNEAILSERIKALENLPAAKFGVRIHHLESEKTKLREIVRQMYEYIFSRKIDVSLTESALILPKKDPPKLTLNDRLKVLENIDPLEYEIRIKHLEGEKVKLRQLIRKMYRQMFGRDVDHSLRETSH